MLRFGLPLLTFALVLAAPQAVAQTSSTAAAEALFQEGRALFEQGKFAEACPRLAESQRLDPATGTLLALALCQEGLGKLASAWAAFTDVEGRSLREGREDRVKIAREHAAALKPRLSSLTLEVAAESAALAGLEVRVDGAAVGKGSFGIAVPVDGGEHRVEASAPGKAPFQTTVAVANESDAVRVSVPALADAPAAEPALAPAAPPATSDTGSAESGSGMRTAALVTAGAGVVALGVGSFLALSAKSDYDDAEADCNAGVCPEEAYEASEDARSKGTVATVVFVVGGAALATGAVLWFLPPPSESAPAAAGPRDLLVGLGPRGLLLQGKF